MAKLRGKYPTQDFFPDPSYYIPFTGSPNFVVRQEVLEALHKALHAKERVGGIAAVTGMGGVGKTETVIQYAKRYKVDCSGGYCWLNLRESTLALKLLEFAQSRGIKIPQEFAGCPLTLQQQVEWFWRNWKPSEGLVLVVLDDVTEASWTSCIESLPRENRFRVLITTRLQNLDPVFVEEIPLYLLLPEEALQLLTALVGEERVQEELEAAKELCKWLGYLPLGLELVGYYLAEDPDLSIAKMLKRLETQGLTDEALERHQVTRSHAKLGLKPAFELSWQELDSMTQGVGKLLSLFAPDIFAWQWVESAVMSLNWAELDVKKAKKQLLKHHLIRRVENTVDCFKIHPLIREFLRVELAVSEQANDIKRASVETFVAIAEEISSSPQKLTKLMRSAVPHFAEIALNLTDEVNDKDLITVFNSLGGFYEEQGLYDLAEILYQRCLEVVRSRFGEEHLSVADSLINLAGLYRLQGRYAESEALYRHINSSRPSKMSERTAES